MRAAVATEKNTHKGTRILCDRGGAGAAAGPADFKSRMMYAKWHASAMSEHAASRQPTTFSNEPRPENPILNTLEIAMPTKTNTPPITTSMLEGGHRLLRVVARAAAGGGTGSSTIA